MTENEITIETVIAKAREMVVAWIDNYVWIHGFTEKECAKTLGTSISTISRIITYGVNAPLSDKMFLKLADKISEIHEHREN